MPTLLRTTSPSIYVVCLNSYNAGTIHGAWVDAAQSSDGIYEDVHETVLRTSPYPNTILADYDCGECGETFTRAYVERDPALRCPDCEGEDQISLSGPPYGSSEEWAIHSYEDFGSFAQILGESESFERISTIADGIERSGNADAYLGYYQHVGGFSYATPEEFQDLYRGEWSSLAEFARENWEVYGSGPYPDNLEPFIDFQGIGEMWEMDFLFTADSSSGIHVYLRP